jgi:hypothetical protein
VRLNDTGFSFRHVDGDERLVVCMGITGNRSDLDALIARVNVDLEDIHHWSIENGQLLNLTKSQAILVSNSPPELLLPLLFLDDIALECKDVVTDLGLLIDSCLRFGRHVTIICSRVYSTLHRLQLLQFLTPKSVRLKLCKALLLPHFSYCDIVFSSLFCLDGWRLQVAYNSCIRRFDHLSLHRDFLLGSVLVRGIRLWNGLPLVIKESRSVTIFAGRYLHD